MPKDEQIPKDFFKKGENVRAVIKKLTLKNNKANIVLSRIAPEFVMRLFEQEVPEVFDGIITIKKVVRVLVNELKLLLNLMMIELIRLELVLE